VFVEGFECADERTRVLEGYPDSVVYVLQHFIILAHRHLDGLFLNTTKYKKPNKTSAKRPNLKICTAGVSFEEAVGSTCRTKIRREIQTQFKFFTFIYIMILIQLH
jgi:hypothetical protein